MAKKKQARKTGLRSAKKLARKLARKPAGSSRPAAPATATAKKTPGIVVEALCVGDEILLGELVDTNMGHVARELWRDGFLVRHKQVVGDRLADVAAAFRLALSRSNVIIVTGGLGPTDDDLTREGLAEVLKRKIHVDDKALAHMAVLWKRPVESITPINRRQAHMIEGAETLLNDWGAACGMHLTHGKAHIFLMPGVPREMKGMLEHRVQPILRKLYGRPGHGSRTLVMVSGIPESRIGELIRKVAPQFPLLTFGTRVNDGECAVRIDGFLHDPTPAAVKALEKDAAAARKEIRRLMSFHVYGEGDLSIGQAVVDFATKHKFVLGTAESCTTGLVSSRIGEIAGASNMYDGGLISYANVAKTSLGGVPEALIEKHGAVSPEVVRAMAEGARALAERLRPSVGTGAASRAIGIGISGVAGPHGGTADKPVGLVYIGIASALGSVAIKTQNRGDRAAVRSRAASRALFEALLEMRRLAAGESKA
ncbi:MAG TPA: CinA family nicotinamide mononucleotide deamidase-related protein [Planctomycetota bacterium]|jgi:nicotinamide-nucleotide amidase|nr:CinA family nicotinamide mononucleotide deamidase-related protein [Planctomycetota bacterium]